MDVSNDAGPPESSLSTYDIPCVLCRRRRVRCSKTLPCQNCDKAGVACSYDDPERTIRRPSRHAELSDRLARLEMLVKKSAITQDKQSSSVDVTSTDTLQKTAQSMESLVLQLQQELKKSADGSLSKLTFVEGRSAYIQAGFWAGMYEEIASLKYMIEDDSTSESAFYFPFIPAPDYQPISPPKEQSDVFLRVFSENVSPFVRVLHGPRLTFEVNDFRKGKLPDAHIFECQLFVLFALAIITLKPEECIAEFGQEKSVLIKSFKHAAEHGLAHLQIASTHKIRTLQVYLLYITFLFWTGETAQASGLVGLAMRYAQRVGIHRDGTQYSLSPWRVEMRRRLWHHLVLLDTWCLETGGSESMVFFGQSNTALPQNSNDSHWDACEFAPKCPEASIGFTDMTVALVQYEIAIVSRAVLQNILEHGHAGPYLHFDEQLLLRARERIEETYLKHLDTTKPKERLVQHITSLAFERLFFAAYQPLFKLEKGGARATSALQDELYERAIAYCEKIQHLRAEYEPLHLDWIIIRCLSWHSIAIILTNCHRRQSNDLDPQTERSRSLIEGVFQDRLTDEYMAGNRILWLPLEQLRNDLNTPNFDGSSPDILGKWPSDSLGDFEIDLQDPFYFNAPLEP